MTTEKHRSFAWLNATQFMGALNDNAFKLLIIFYLIEQLVPAAGEPGPSSESISAVATGLFALPFLLFSALAGTWADRFSKRTIVVAAKWMELGIMLCGLLCFFFGLTFPLYAVLFLMAAQSTLFSPAKYGIVPELVERGALAKANGLLTALTYLAIIIGTALTPFLLSVFHAQRYAGAALISVLVAVAGVFFSVRITRTPAGGGESRATLLFFRDIFRTLWGIRKESYLITAVIGSAFFLHVGAFVQINIIPYGIDALGLEEKSGYLFLAAALGIGLGSLLSGILSGRNVEVGIVPFGALGICLTVFSLAASPNQTGLVALIMVLLGVSAGLFIVPINAYIQFASPRDHLGQILAASSFLSWIGVLLAAALTLLCKRAGLDAKHSFWVAGVLSLAVLLGSIRILGDFAVRFAILSVVRLFYRVRVRGVEQIPLEGPALLISNHVSHVDALLIAAQSQRRIRFVMWRKAYEHRWLNGLFQLMGAIPISYDDGPKKLAESIQAARKALADGYLVCVFAEGALTRNGLLREFQPGFEKMNKGVDAPVIPVYLGGVWGSIFSYADRKLLARWPRQIPYPVSVYFGEPLAPGTPAHEVRVAVQELEYLHFESKKPERLSLPETFLRTARLNWRRQALSDTTGRKLTFGRTATAAVLLRDLIRKEGSTDSVIGVLMPTTALGAIVNLGITLAGRIPVNLNYTASVQTTGAALKRAGCTRVFTVGIFHEKVGAPVWEGVELIDVVPMLTSAGKRQRLGALLKARCCPTRVIAKRSRFSADDTATVIFSSGSTGEPKGVMLSHHNILSNIESFRTLVQVEKNDVICSALPFFHSFGYTVGLWLPLVSGFGAAYHPNPMEAARLGELAQAEKATVMLATPTFLLSYLRKVKPEQFQTLRLMVVGAEKLKTKVADAFEERFGVRPIEGYGATECSPVISLNIPDREIDGVFQAGTRPGSAGVSIPGVCTRVVDPSEGRALPAGEPGLLWVKGPNVMKGYLNDPERTAEVLQDGWYNTGDIVRIDPEGFIFITDRLSRFSKIGGEMVPHAAVEAVLSETLPAGVQCLAVTSIPHEKKGEQLAVLYTDEAGDIAPLQDAVEQSELANLWRPSRQAWYPVDFLPLLGSGKLDIRKLREMASDAARAVK